MKSQSEGQFLHEQVDIYAMVKSMKVIGTSRKAHQQTAERHEGRPKISNYIRFSSHKEIVILFSWAAKCTTNGNEIQAARK